MARSVGLLLAAILLTLPATGRQSLDDRALLTINRWETSAASTVLGAADRSAYPVYYAAIPAAWIVRAAGGGPPGDAWRLTLGAVGTYALVRLLKPAIGRRRPFERLASVSVRSSYPGAVDLDPFAMPSGHSAMAAVIAVTLSLEHPHAYVAAPALAWAAAVGVSRIWLGVHYPSDVMAGWLLGTGVALLIQQVGATPDRLNERPLFRTTIPIG